MLEGLFLDDNYALDKSILNMGNLGRIKNVIEKARAGETITLGFLGGFITAGSGSGEGKPYVRFVSKFWQESFPMSKITSFEGG